MQNMFFCPLILVISGKNGLMPTFLCNALVGGWSLLQVMARLKVGAAAIWVFLIIPCAELLHTPEVFTAGFLPVLNIWARVDDTQRSLKNAGMIPSTGRLDVCWSKWLGSEKSENGLLGCVVSGMSIMYYFHATTFFCHSSAFLAPVCSTHL